MSVITWFIGIFMRLFEAPHSPICHTVALAAEAKDCYVDRRYAERVDSLYGVATQANDTGGGYRESLIRVLNSHLHFS
jgi:hypothetical protein